MTLRERPGDIRLLAEHFLKLSCGEAVDPEVYPLLEAHSWPGNVRELQNAVEYGLARASTGAFTLDCLPDELRDGKTPDVSLPDIAARVNHLMQSGCNFLQAVEQAAIEAMLHKVSGNKCQAARALRMSRTTLDKKLHQMARNDASHLTTCPETGQ